MDTPEDDEEREWQELALAEFLKGYAPSDAIYDEEQPDSLEKTKDEDHE